MGQVSWVRQLALATALLVLGTFAYWLEYKHKPEQENAEENTKKLFVLKDTQIESIEITDGSKKFDWSCMDLAAKTCKPGDNSKWQMTEPMQVRADDSNVNSLVSSLNNLTSTEVLDLKDETPDKRAALLKEYGLSPEARSSATVRKITVKTPSGETVIYFGGTHPINENIFALEEKVPSGQKPSGKADETKVFLVPGYFKANFDHDTTYWRDKKILAFTPSEIASFEINSKKNGKLAAEKRDSTWILKSAGGEFTGDIENIDALLNAASFLTAKDFVTDHKADEKAKAALKGAKQFLSVTFEKTQGTAKENPAPVTLTLIEKGNQVFATVSNTDPLYELQPGARNQFDKELKDLRLMKLITSMDRFSAKRLEFSGTPIGATPLILESDGSKWTKAPQKTEVNGEKIQSTLDKLSGNRIKEFLTGSAIPAGEQQGLKFSLGDEKNPKKRQLVFWKVGDKLYARDLGSARKEAFLVDSTVTNGLPWTASYYDKAPKK